MKLLKLVIAGTLALGVASTSLSADAVKGQKFFSKLLKEPCGMTGAKFAAKHTQDEWKQLKEGGKFKAEIVKICPNVKADDLSDSVIENVYDFSFDFEEYLYDVYEEKERQNLENVKKQKISQIDKKARKLKKTIESLPKKEELEFESSSLYEKANLILSNLHNIKPYQKSLKVFDYTGIEVQIDLEEKPSASKYSNDLFKKAKRAKQKASNISLEKDNLDEKLGFLLRLMNNINNANSIEECEFLSPKKERNQIKTKKSSSL